MELEGLKRGLTTLENVGVHANHLVTDRHSMVKKYMRTVHPQKKHHFDVWHMAKGRVFLSKYHNVYIIQYASTSTTTIHS